MEYRVEKFSLTVVQIGIVKMVTQPACTDLNSGAYTRPPCTTLDATAGPLCVHVIYMYSISISMERTIQYYLIESLDYANINRVWDWCQYSGRDVPMYKTRISAGSTGWVVELDPADKASTFFLLNFSHLVTAINAPRYYR